MSRATLTEGKQGVLAAWETTAQVYYAVVNPKTSGNVRPPSRGRTVGAALMLLLTVSGVGMAFVTPQNQDIADCAMDSRPQNV